jgi:hypothetical protein
MGKQESEFPNIEAKNHAVNFLMAEYSELNQEFRRLRGEGLNRLNFFIAITSSILGGLVFLSQSSNTPGLFLKVTALGAMLFLILIGWETFRFTIGRDISADENLRRIGKIRRFFADNYPPVIKYLPWQIHDEPTNWVTRNTSAIRQVAQSIVSLLLMLIAIISASFFTTQIILLGISGVVSFVVAFATLGFYAKNKYKKATLVASKESKFSKGK